MGKLLPVLGILAAVLSAVHAKGDAVPFLALAFLWLCAVALFLERRLPAVLAGAALLLLGLSALLHFNPVVRNGATLVPDLPAFFEGAWQSVLFVLAWGAIFLARSEDVEPTWLLAAAPVAAGLAILATLFIPSSQFGNTAASNLVAAFLDLLLVWPMAQLLRHRAPEPAPAPSPFAPSPVTPIPPGLKPAKPAPPQPFVAAPLKKAPAKAAPPPEAAVDKPVGKRTPKK